MNLHKDFYGVMFFSIRKKESSASFIKCVMSFGYLFYPF